MTSEQCDQTPDQAASETTASVPPEEQGAPTGLSSLHNRDFRLYYAGAMISNVGFWMQAVAQGWLIVTLTDSELALGLVNFCAMIPSLLFSLPGGVLADRIEKRYVLMFTQGMSAVFVLILGVLIHTGSVRIWEIMLVAFATGTMGALAQPAFQTIVPELVGRKNLLNAIALNSARFNLTRAIGPTIAGFLIKVTGIAGAYYLNSVSYLALVGALVLVRPKYRGKQTAGLRGGLFAGMGPAMRYVRQHSLIRTVVLMAAVQTLFLVPYSTLLPIFAKDTLHMDAGGYGLLLAAVGLGAFVGAIGLAFKGEVGSKGRLMLAMQVTFALGVAVFSFSHWLVLSLAMLVLVGFALVVFMATGNTLIQVIVPEEMSGRVMSIWSLVVMGLMPIGSLLAGGVAQLLTPTIALSGGAVISLILSVAIVLREPALFGLEMERSPALS